jgi:hypothetical protein
VSKQGPSYEATERVQLGLKLINPKEPDQHPVCYRLIDTPGSILALKRASMYTFRKSDIVFVVFDGSKKLDEDLLREWTMFTLTQIYNYHKASTAA